MVEPVTTLTATAIATTIATKAFEKTGEKVGEGVWALVSRFLAVLKRKDRTTARGDRYPSQASLSLVCSGKASSFPFPLHLYGLSGYW
ncbi:hypothetical protein [Argonema galeatum]|uniref:hypothetical protein n=1 Tax=Argonema galeatum TaxID=2942762 RepID=UPI002012187A|nr:hypothetical protein [Argonema galeatum]MCL1465264.1 hypothetical protein [Argonema galeatum A003/A1]